MDKTFEITVGSAPIDQQLEFRALSVRVDNPTNQWVQLDSLGVPIPQYTLGTIYPLGGTTRARFSFTAPAGQVEPPTIAGQRVSVTFSEMALAPSPGIGMLGGRAAYYDRAPLSVYPSFSSNAVAPSVGVIVQATYTVPANRRAFAEVVSLIARRSAAAAPVGRWGPGLNVTPVNGALTTVVWVRDTVNTVDAVKQWVAPFGTMIAGDKFDLFTEDDSTGGSVDYTLTSKIIEFDA